MTVQLTAGTDYALNKLQLAFEPVVKSGQKLVLLSLAQIVTG